jgi:hypothetical protein
MAPPFIIRKDGTGRKAHPLVGPTRRELAEIGEFNFHTVLFAIFVRGDLRVDSTHLTRNPML